MTEHKKVLLIGLDPAVVDYKRWPGLTPEKLEAGLRADEKKLNELGYEASICYVDHGETGCKTPDAASYIKKTVAHNKKKAMKARKKG